MFLGKQTEGGHLLSHEKYGGALILHVVILDVKGGENEVGHFTGI